MSPLGTILIVGDRLESAMSEALVAAADPAASAAERAQRLMEVAADLQRRAETAQHLAAAVDLYDRALAVCPEAELLLRARIAVRQGTALQAVPDSGTDCLPRARAALEEAIPVLLDRGRPEELAEAEMNLGLVVQSLAGVRRARITDAIAAYQRALRTFDPVRHPREYAILQNHLATAFLSIPFTDERGQMRGALAVQAFEEGLRVVTLVEHPTEYAMLQNNLGNALQYASSSHTLDNNLRALEAYDEALRVRTRDAAPLDYANTIANRANCLWNLPDDPQQPGRGNHANLARARAAYAEARDIFTAHGELDKARIVAEAVDQIQREILALVPGTAHPMPA